MFGNCGSFNENKMKCSILIIHIHTKRFLSNQNNNNHLRDLVINLTSIIKSEVARKYSLQYYHSYLSVLSSLLFCSWATIDSHSLIDIFAMNSVSLYSEYK